MPLAYIGEPLRRSRTPPRAIPREGQEVYSNALSGLKETLVLSERQKQVLVGTVLGDGYLFPASTNRAVGLRLCHREEHGEYIQWKYREFENWILTPPRLQVQTDKRDGSISRFWYCKTVTHPRLKPYRDVFYVKRRKVVPDCIEEMLTAPLSLAVWFMDDGGRDKRQRCAMINTQCFTLADQDKLRRCLQRNFGLTVTIRATGVGRGHRLYISAEQVERLCELVEPYLLPTMRYKLPVPL